MFHDMASLGPRASIAALTLLMLTTGPMGPARADTPLGDLGGLAGTEPVDILLAAGLDARAEQQLRGRLAKGDSSVCVPLLQLLVRRHDVKDAARSLARWEKTSAISGEAALFTTGRVHESGERNDAAVTAYLASAVHEPLLADHATYRAALALQALGRRRVVSIGPRHSSIACRPRRSSLRWIGSRSKRAWTARAATALRKRARYAR